MSWKKHLKYINSKISRSLFAMKQCKVFLPKESLRTLYFSLINSHIVYGIIAWGNAKHDIIFKTKPTFYKSALYEQFTIQNIIVTPIRCSNSQ